MGRKRRTEEVTAFDELHRQGQIVASQIDAETDFGNLRRQGHGDRRYAGCIEETKRCGCELTVERSPLHAPPILADGVSDNYVEADKQLWIRNPLPDGVD